MEERTFVRVSRNWKDHEIQHTVCFDKDGVCIEAPLDQFITALAKEIVAQETPDTFLQRIKTAINKNAGFSLDSRKLEVQLTTYMDAVIRDMKEQTKY